MGLGDRTESDRVAVESMRTELGTMEISGRVVIGEGERDEAPMLFVGEEVGSAIGRKGALEVDIAVDPLEGTNLCATGAAGAIGAPATGGPVGLFAPDVGEGFGWILGRSHRLGVDHHPVGTVGETGEGIGATAGGGDGYRPQGVGGVGLAGGVQAMGVGITVRGEPEVRLDALAVALLVSVVGVLAVGPVDKAVGSSKATCVSVLSFRVAAECDGFV